ncbi:MAG: hypothetical protein GF308_09975 [Candidatus Heimdallarchaeota archaeon]|nr:hypothetical protein [Candidatus Heimdallarchaeota archaeon]
MIGLLSLGATEILLDMGKSALFCLGRFLMSKIIEKKGAEKPESITKKTDLNHFKIAVFQQMVDDFRIYIEQTFNQAIEKSLKAMNAAVYQDNQLNQKLAFINAQLEELDSNYRRGVSTKVPDDFAKAEDCFQKAGEIMICDSLISLEIMHFEEAFYEIEKTITMNQNIPQAMALTQELVNSVEEIRKLVKYRVSQQKMVWTNLFTIEEFLSEDTRMIFEEAEKLARDEVSAQLMTEDLQQGMTTGKIRRPFWFIGKRKYKEEVEKRVLALITDLKKQGELSNISVGELFLAFEKRNKDLDLSLDYFLNQLQTFSENNLINLTEDNVLIIEPTKEPAITEEEKEKKEQISCYYCGTLVPNGSEYCPSCCRKIPLCTVCDKPIGFQEPTLMCVFCESLAHSDEVLKWKQEVGRCPACTEELHTETLIPPRDVAQGIKVPKAQRETTEGLICHDCNQPIHSETIAAFCPNCGVAFHYDHLLTEILQNNHCPYCNYTLDKDWYLQYHFDLTEGEEETTTISPTAEAIAKNYPEVIYEGLDIARNIKKLVENSEKTIDMACYLTFNVRKVRLGDEKITVNLAALIEEANTRNIKVRIITQHPDNIWEKLGYHQRRFLERVTKLNNVSVIFCPGIHVKMLISDKKEALFGSANFTATGLSGRNDYMKYSNDPDEIEEYSKIFKGRWTQTADVCKECEDKPCLELKL